jgi:hypothetical protein
MPSFWEHVMMMDPMMTRMHPIQMGTRRPNLVVIASAKKTPGIPGRKRVAAKTPSRRLAGVLKKAFQAGSDCRPPRRP